MSKKPKSGCLAVVIEQHSKIPIVPESRSTIDFILMPGKNWRSSIILLRATSGSLFELHVGHRWDGSWRNDGLGCLVGYPVVAILHYDLPASGRQAREFSLHF